MNNIGLCYQGKEIMIGVDQNYIKEYVVKDAYWMDGYGKRGSKLSEEEMDKVFGDE